jgi:phosphoribosylaminoimidazole carboxylase
MPNLIQAMEGYLAGLETEVMGKVETLEAIGWEKYDVKR